MYLLLDTRQLPVGPEQWRRAEKTVKSMAVSQRALVSSSQSSKVALLAPLFAPTSTGKKKKKEGKNSLIHYRPFGFRKCSFICTKGTVKEMNV